MRTQSFSKDPINQKNRPVKLKPVSLLFIPFLILTTADKIQAQSLKKSLKEQQNLLTVSKALPPKEFLSQKEHKNMTQEPDNQNQSLISNIVPVPVPSVPENSPNFEFVNPLLNLAQTAPDRPKSGGQAPTLTPQPTVPQQAPIQREKQPLHPSPIGRERQKTITSPGISITTPAGYGKSWGRASVGIAFQQRTRFTNEADGAIGLSVGLGDPQKSIGVDVGMTILSLNDSFGDRGSFSVKLHRLFPDDWGVALGWQNALVWGGTDGGSSLYLVGSKLFRLQQDTSQPFSQLYISAGVGNGQYRSEFQIEQETETIGVFGSAALRVVEAVSVIGEWTGQDLNLGVSIAPFPEIPLVITPALADVTNNAGDGARFILGIGYSFSFR